MRILAILLVLAFVATLSGCATQYQRDWGYIDTPSTQAGQSELIILGKDVPQNVKGLQGTVHTAPPQILQQYQSVPLNNAVNPASVNRNRITYEHNTERFDADTLIHAGFLGLGIVDTILRFDHLARHPHSRWYRW